jgi:hypothetical protein
MAVCAIKLDCTARALYGKKFTDFEYQTRWINFLIILIKYGTFVLGMRLSTYKTYKGDDLFEKKAGIANIFVHAGNRIVSIADLRCRRQRPSQRNNNSQIAI